MGGIASVVNSLFPQRNEGYFRHVILQYILMIDILGHYSGIGLY